ncbi:MAG: hypothetical protein OEX07_08920 [Gammaproteobacteria bacterium]|nr:hypothetical protein [Gammaproteobacteria bacterium]
MSKSKIILFVIILGLLVAYFFTLKTDGSYFYDISKLIEKKAENNDNKRSHTLDLEDYRPKLFNQGP